MSYSIEVSDHTEGQSNRIHIDFNKQALMAGLVVYYLEDNGYFINYIPALNLSSYGETPEQAREMIEFSLNDYAQELLKLSKPAVLEELSKLGWAIVSRDMGDFENSAYVDKDGILRNFDLPQDTKIEEGVLSIA